MLNKLEMMMMMKIIELTTRSAFIWSGKSILTISTYDKSTFTTVLANRRM